MIATLSAFAQLFFTMVIGVYFFIKLRNESFGGTANNEESKKQAERLHLMRHVSLTEPLSEQVRPHDMEEIVGQADGIKALKAALCGKNPQHIIIYGPPGVGKTAAARIALNEA